MQSQNEMIAINWRTLAKKKKKARLKKTNLLPKEIKRDFKKKIIEQE